jgi:hypothetical protein
VVAAVGCFLLAGFVLFIRHDRRLLFFAGRAGARDEVPPFPLLQQPQCGSDKLACAAVTTGDMARGRRRGVSSDAPRNSLPASLSNVTEPLRGFAMSTPVPLRDFDAALLRKLARGVRRQSI